MEEGVPSEDLWVDRVIRDLCATRRAYAEEQAELIHSQIDVYPLGHVHRRNTLWSLG